MDFIDLTLAEGTTGDVSNKLNIDVDNISNIGKTKIREIAGTAPSTSGSNYGVKGDYSTQYGILECPNGIFTVDGMTVTLKQGVVMQCAGQDIKTTVASDMPFEITATNDVDLFYAGGANS